jgi:hypothetical protein
MWTKLIYGMLLIMLLIYVATETYTIVEVSKYNLTDFTVCNNPSLMILQIDEALVIIFLAILANFISRRIKE